MSGRLAGLLTLQRVDRLPLLAGAAVRWGLRSVHAFLEHYHDDHKYYVIDHIDIYHHHLDVHHFYDNNDIHYDDIHVDYLLVYYHQDDHIHDDL